MEVGDISIAVMPEVVEGPLLETPEEKVFALAAKVFGNHLIREAIVDHAIRQTRGFLDLPTICSMRAVSKDWNDSVCKLLHQRAEPMFEIRLGKRNKLNNVVRPDTSTELLEQFTQTFESSADVLGRTPTFQLWLRPKAFCQENYDSLYNFLLGCGNGLVRIILNIPRNGGSMEGAFPNLSLPSLHRASFWFNDKSLEQPMTSSDNIANLVQSILSGATALKKLQISHYSTQPYPINVFERLVLPPTLEQVDVWGRISSGHLLVNNHLPNLKSLDLQTSAISMPVGHLTRILENVRWTLTRLILQDDTLYGRTQNTLLFRFPVMEKLERFGGYSQRCVLEPGTRSLETYLPKLRILGFSRQSSEEVRKWTSSRLCSVKDLYLSIQDNELNFNPAFVSQIHFTFPNVTILELVFEEIPISGLQCMFREMTNLTELTIRTSARVEDEPLVDWDSLLIGMSPEVTEKLRAEPALWEKIQINDEDPSIRKLTDLRSFSIEHDPQYVLMISDVAFHFAFLKMPRLEKLDFTGRTSISSHMTDTWKWEGRLLNFLPLY